MSAEPATTPLPIAEALRRLAASRDAQAWESLLVQCGPDIAKVTRRILGDAGLAEDACQETLLQIRAHAGAFHAPAGEKEAQLAARVWVMRIASNIALSMLRSRSRSQRREDMIASTTQTIDHSGPAERQLKAEESEILRREVASLPDAVREPILLRYFGELDYAELGAALACSPDAAKKRVQRGLDQLRSRLAIFGVALTVADLAAHLAAPGAAHAAEAAAITTASQHFAWQGLLNASAAPALTGVVPVGGFSIMLKLSLVAAVVALIGTGAVFTYKSGSGSGSGSGTATPTASVTAKETAPAIKAPTTPTNTSDEKTPEFTTVPEGRTPAPPPPVEVKPSEKPKVAETPPPVAPVPPPPIETPRAKTTPPNANGKAGSLKGRIKYNGVPPEPRKLKIAPDKQQDCHREQIISEDLVVDPNNRGIKWAMIRIMGVNAPLPAVPFEPASLDQKGCMFQPHALIVAPGTNLTVLNSEKAAHNFHTTPLDATNPGFNRMMTPGDEKTVLKGEKYFAEPEVIKMQCDIHPWMAGFIVVHDPRFAAISAGDGSFEIPNVPPGKYDVVIFHELGEQTIKVEIKAGETAEIGEVLFPAKK